jgi:exopolysaccharide biosynthesis protein
MRRFLTVLSICFSIIGFLLIAAVIFFSTPYGTSLRITAAEAILSSQHRYLAKFTFLPQSELDQLLAQIQHPKYKNTILVTLGETNTTTPAETTTEPSKLTGLVVKVTTVEKSYSPTYYYVGKMMTISNPKDVELEASALSDWGQQIFVLARAHGAIGAINASGFVDQNGVGNGGTATGIVINKGKIANQTTTSDGKDFVAGFTSSGQMVTGRYSAQELVDLGVQYAAGFRPELIANGEKMITSGDGGWGIGPRTAIGQKKDGTVVFLVIDGRQPGRSIGATMKEVQDILYKAGCVNAMAMDGGSSASMYFNNENITTPSSVGHVPRYLPNIWAVIPGNSEKVTLYEDEKQIKSSEVKY